VDTFGQEFKHAVMELRPGEYSKPVESPWGYHVIRREAMSDNDIAGLLKNEFLDAKHAEVLNAIRANAKIEQPGQPADDAVPELRH
jgi:parvulin-like peptidyl-prolyl isomerase